MHGLACAGPQDVHDRAWVQKLKLTQSVGEGALGDNYPYCEGPNVLITCSWVQTIHNYLFNAPNLGSNKFESKTRGSEVVRTYISTLDLKLVG